MPQPLWTCLLAVLAIATVPGPLHAEAEVEGRLILHEDFSDGMEDWWVEGGQEVWVEEGRLHVRANPPADAQEGYAATVWHRTPIEGDVRIEMQAHVLASEPGVNNINTFLFYADPEGRPLYQTRHERADANYGYYHDLDGYIVTFLATMQDGDAMARTRLRRCPGFELIHETLHPMGVHEGQTYHLVFTRIGDTLSVEANGENVGEMTDPERHERGLLGLRTFRTYLWWDEIRVYDLSERE